MVKKEAPDTGYVKWFSELNNKDVPIAGGKGASLAEMYVNGFPIPPGFVVTAQAYAYFIASSKLDEKIRPILERVNTENTEALQDASRKIRELIESSPMPPELEQEIVEAYDILDTSRQNMHQAKSTALDILKNSHEPPFVAVRSSATTEDLADASFAGQQDSFLNIKGHAALLENIKKCFSSLFTARAIYYRQKKGFAYEKALLAVVIQRMVDSQKSGVMFSRNPLKDDDSIVVEAVWGLGEGIVSGQIVPDHYTLNRELEVQEMKVSDKKIAIVRSSSGSLQTAKLTGERSNQQVLTGYELKRLAQYALDLEQHYGKPQDIEFAISQEVYIVQSRPITTKPQVMGGEVTGNVLLSGLGASPGVSSGTVKIVRSLNELGKIQKGDVLVTMMTNPDMVVTMQRAAGIITDEGGITSHAAIISREMGIPCVVGTRTATQSLTEGQVVTVDGSTGRVIDGKAEEKRVEIKPIVPTRTDIKVIVDLPDYAQRAALSGAQGVGLVRLEGIIATSSKHPVWYIKNDKIKEYITLISAGLRKIALPFKEIWVRTSDIRSDEFRHLEGAPQMIEGNPMLGNHGIRFSLRNVDLLEAEFNAIKEIADEFHDKKIGVMMPQVISVDEVKLAKKIAQGMNLPENVRIGIMVETPAAVQIINELCEEGISFVSFGTNDLTQYTLAIDRNNPDVQELYNEMHPAVMHSIQYVIRRCKKYGVETSVCGQAASREDMARFLIQEGIDSLSVNADAAEAVSKIVAEIEKNVSSHQENSTMPRKKENNATFSAEPIKSTLEEQIILKALESTPNDYAPGFTKGEDIPALNDAIPIESDHFEDRQEDETVSVF